MTVSREAIAEFAAMTRDHPNEIVYSDYVTVLLARLEAAETRAGELERALRVAKVLADYGFDLQLIEDWAVTLSSEEQLIAWFGADAFDGGDMDRFRAALAGSSPAADSDTHAAALRAFVEGHGAHLQERDPDWQPKELTGSSPAAEAEPFVLTLAWRCMTCGQRWTMDAPGFPGDGRDHSVQPGNVTCGPLAAQRALPGEAAS